MNQMPERCVAWQGVIPGLPRSPNLTPVCDGQGLSSVFGLRLTLNSDYFLEHR